jgi:putative acetyltransferase
MAAAITIESPLSEDVRALIVELNAVLLELTPPEHCYHLTPEEMAGADTTLFVAREDGVPIACGALKRYGRIGEVKRMYTRPSYQGRGLGGRILAEIERLARSEGLEQLVLETGDRHPAAWRVYERAGFVRCGAVLDYPESSWSVFYAKPLLREATAA